MALADKKSMFGNINRNISLTPLSNLNGTSSLGRTNLKPITSIVMSGGYIPGNNYGDDVGFDEF